MLANNNLKICRKLVRRDFRFHRMKNLLLIFASALVTGLYAFVFLLGSSVESAFLLSYQYSYGSTSHILYTGLTGHQADSLAGDARVKSTVRLNTVGLVTDPRLGQRSVKLAVTDRDYAETVLSVPTTGSLPEKEGEIALDEFTLDSLGIAHKLGTEVRLSWTDAAGETRTDDFTLCGWWSSPTNFAEACAWVGEDTAKELLPGYDSEEMPNVTLGVNLHQPRDLESQAQELLEDQGVVCEGYSTNLAYNDARREMAASQAMPFYYPAILVIVCGFLMVYSIVRVSSERDLQYYAGLKALGMTPRQLFRILLEQGLLASCAGLLPGFAIGFLIHLGVTSRIVVGFEENPALYFLSWQPFAAAALCTAATVLLAYFAPARSLTRLRPAEMRREAEKKAVAGKGSRKGGGRVSLPVLALRSLKRGRAHLAFSTVSLFLSLLLIALVWMSYISYREDIYLETMSPWDYSIADGSAYLSLQRYNEGSTAVTDQTAEEMRNRPEVTKVSGLKSREVRLEADDTLRQRIVDYYNQPYDETMTLKESQAGFPEWVSGLEHLEETGEYTGLVIGLEGSYLEYVVKNCPFTSGSFDAEKFESGEYVLASGAYYEGISTPMQGETLTLAGKELEVIGSVMTDNAYLSGSNSPEASFNIIYYIPLTLFDELFPGQGFRQLAVDIDHGQQKEFEAYLDEYEQEQERGVGITRRSEYQENFENARLNEVLPALIVSIVLLFIGILNFINMLVAKTVSRRKEFAVYESLGMTCTQMKQLLLLEGGFHGVFAAAAAGGLAAAAAWFVMPVIYASMDSWCMVYTFRLTPLWIVLPVILILSVCVPQICLGFITKGSITQRLGMTE